MKRLLSAVRLHIKEQPVSVFLILFIWIICLVPIPDIPPLKGIKFIDKWTHFVMYGVLVAVIMTEYGRRKSVIRWRRLLCFSLVAAILMSGLIELAQKYLTAGTRSGEWADFAANVVGALLGCLIGILPARYLATRNKGAGR
ncbi:MAG: VanZ family protein [Prevotella sp.]|nr:VanZ family protein [Prevotella sp.]